MVNSLRQVSFLLALLSVFSPRPLWAESARTINIYSSSETKRLKRFEKQVEQLRRLLKIPGLSAVIIKDQKVLWVKGFGYADVEKRIPAAPNTLYHIASLTKTLASTILMQLVEQGKLSLDEPMADYSRDFKDDRVSIKHVLSHTSGGETPGERYRYDGARYALLTAVIEKKTGKSFRELVAEMFLEPLKMTDSVPGRSILKEADKLPAFFSPDKLDRYRLALKKSALPYRLYGNEAVRTGYGWSDISASSGLLTTALDIAKFDAAIDRHIYLKKDTQDLAWTRFVSNSGKSLPHGLGWFVQDYNGEKAIWHFGNDPDSFSATYVKVPGKNISLIVLANSDALSAPFAYDGVFGSSPLIAEFMRIFVGEDMVAKTLPDPHWAQNAENFSNEISRLKKQSGRYTYDGELTSYKAMIKWLGERRQKANVTVKADPRTFDLYAGHYQTPDGAIITVTREGARLMMDIPDYVKSEGFPKEGGRFFLKTLDAEFVFTKDERGNIKQIDFFQDGQTFILKKIK